MNFINQLLGSLKIEKCILLDLADMQLITKYNKGIRYLLFAIDLFSNYTFVVPLKDKKLLLLMHFNVFWTVQKENQIKYGLIKVVSFTKTLLKND